MSTVMKPSVLKQKGATLLEVLIAILIFSVGILAIVGVQALATRVTTDSKYRADASFLANQALGRVWGDPANIANFGETETTVTELPGGKRSVEVNGNRVTVTLTWQLPGEANKHNFVATGYVTAE